MRNRTIQACTSTGFSRFFRIYMIILSILKNLVNPVSIRFEFSNCFGYIRGLRQDFIFELGRVRDESIEVAHALHRSIEIFEQLIANPRSDLGAVPKRQ